MAKKSKLSAAVKKKKTQPSKKVNSSAKKSESKSAASVKVSTSKESSAKLATAKMTSSKVTTSKLDGNKKKSPALDEAPNKKKASNQNSVAKNNSSKTAPKSLSKAKTESELVPEMADTFVDTEHVKASPTSLQGQKKTSPVNSKREVAPKKEPAPKKAKRPMTIKERFPSTGGSSLDLFKARPKSRPSTMSAREDEFFDEDEHEVQQVQKMAKDEPAALNKKWNQLHEKHKSKKALNYKLSETFEVKTPIIHKTLGWGYILNISNDRLEVLFREGVKHLISNYKK